MVELATRELSTQEAAAPKPCSFEAALLTGGQDRPYALGLALGVVAQGVRLDIIGSDEVDSPEFHGSPQMKFLNLRGSQEKNAGFKQKVLRLFSYYARLIRYAAVCSPRVFHILWNNKFEYFDRTALMAYYKLLGKKVTLTAHNVNAGRRDDNDSWMNRLTLRIQYRLADHIFVHTEKMKSELVDEFGVKAKDVTVLIHPINDVFPDTNLSPADAKQKLGIAPGEKVLLFFGRIRPYKGLEYLIAALDLLLARDAGYRLIIAGEQKKGSEEYAERIEGLIRKDVASGAIIPKFEFIPDEEAELYFKAADLLVLPYKEIFQSGVLFLSYGFGLPVLATDVGSFRETIQEGRTGMICPSCEPADLAEGIRAYFASSLYQNLDARRQDIRDYAHAQHSWDAAAELICNAYRQLTDGNSR